MNKKPLTAAISALALAGSLKTTCVLAQESMNDLMIEEIITTGTRIQGRSAPDSAAPKTGIKRKIQKQIDKVFLI